MEATRVALQQTSIDMAMIADDPFYTSRVEELVKTGILPMSRVEQSTSCLFSVSFVYVRYILLPGHHLSSYL